MKFTQLFTAFLLMAAVSFTACRIVPEAPDGPGNPGKPNNPTDTTTHVDPVTPTDIDIPAGAITIAEARDICSKLESGATTGTKYYVKGWVKKLHSKHADGVSSYGNGSFYMVDSQTDSDDFLAYQVYGLNGQKLTDAEQVLVGDYVVIYGELTNYQGTYETVGKGAAYIYSSTNEKLKGGSGQETPSGDAVEATIAQIIAEANTTTLYRVTGKVGGPINAQYGNYDLIDETGTIYIYGTTNWANYQSKLKEGDEITVEGKFAVYNGKNELKDVKIVAHKAGEGGGEVTPGVTDAEVTTVSAILAEKSTTKTYQITGKVGGPINTQYGNYDIEDATGKIYIYGTTNWANYKNVVKEGDELTVQGKYEEYNGKAELKNVTIVAHVAGEGGGEVTPTDPTEPEVPGVSGNMDVTVDNTTITIDFSDNPLGLSADLTLKTAQTFSLGSTGYTITIDGSGNASSGTKIIATGNYKQFRMYKSTTFTVTAPAGTNIGTILLETETTVSSSDYSGNNLNIIAGGGSLIVVGAETTWSGNANAVRFGNSNQVRINKIHITPAE
ncbi:MAG: hypothetical protein MJZ89_03560 [Paludibacteraceae bacterium]|nr:hypothetical protein [Paludibacteraceae bacterium]